MTLFVNSLLCWKPFLSALLPSKSFIQHLSTFLALLLLWLSCQMKYIYGTCAGKTVSRRRPSNFIFKMPAINLSNGLNRIGVTRSAIRHGLSLGGLWAYLSQPKISAGRRKKTLSVETEKGVWSGCVRAGWWGSWRRNQMNGLEKKVIKTRSCMHIFIGLYPHMQKYKLAVRRVRMGMCAQRSVQILECISKSQSAQISTLAFVVLA